MYTRSERIAQKDNVRYAYFHVGKGEATLAYVQDDDILYYGVALCAPSDNFCRATGRHIARKRLSSEVRAITPCTRDPKLEAVVGFLQLRRPKWVQCGKDALINYVEYRPSKAMRKHRGY